MKKTYRNAKVDYNALARTALFEMAQQASFAFYDANDDVIVEWIFDATMDYRVCDRCAPLDGQRQPNRTDFSYGDGPDRGQYATRVPLKTDALSGRLREQALRKVVTLIAT